MKSCSLSIIKYLVFAFNAIFSLSGLVLIGAAVYVMKSFTYIKEFLNSSLSALPIVFIVIGVIIFIVASLGCLGAIKENYKMLIAFASLLILIFIMEIAAAIVAVLARDYIKSELKLNMEISRDTYAITSSDIRPVWNLLQYKLKCCGVDGPDDWSHGFFFPEACCTNLKTIPSHRRICRPPKEFLHQEGCYNKTLQIIEEGATVILGVGLGVAFVELAGIVLSLILALAIKKKSAAA